MIDKVRVNRMHAWKLIWTGPQMVDEDRVMRIDTDDVATGWVGFEKDEDDHMVVDSAADEKQASNTDMTGVRSHPLTVQGSSRGLVELGSLIPLRYAASLAYA